MQPTMREDATFAELREQVVAPERISCSWIRDMLLPPLLVQPSFRSWAKQAVELAIGFQAIGSVNLPQDLQWFVFEHPSQIQ